MNIKNGLFEVLRRGIHNVDKMEIEKFKSMAEGFWDLNGDLKHLHLMNPVRMRFIRNCVNSFYGNRDNSKVLEGFDVLDVGCGGGLLAESMSRLGGNVLGIDASKDMINVAKLHQKQIFNTENLKLQYSNKNSEDLKAEEKRFDVITSLEVIEHVPNAFQFLKSCSALLKPGGLLFISTLNKTIKSYLLSIVVAEYLLKMVPRNTHSWEKYQRPENVQFLLEKLDLELVDINGMIFDPFNSNWKLSLDDFDVNYILAAFKPEK